MSDDWADEPRRGPANRDAYDADWAIWAGWCARQQETTPRWQREMGRGEVNVLEIHECCSELVVSALSADLGAEPGRTVQ